MKAMGNPEGPSALACEYVGTSAASWLGLRVFEHAVVHFPDHLARGVKDAVGGPAFATKFTPGIVWDGSSEVLQLLENSEDLAGLVVLDTWTRNRDRYLNHRGEVRRNLRNVYLTDGERAGKYAVYAIDHTHCVRNETVLHSGDLRMARDPTLFGLFPEFAPFITPSRVDEFSTRLRTFSLDVARSILMKVPPPWLRSEHREEFAAFLAERAMFVAANVKTWIAPACAWQPQLFMETLS